MFSVTGICNVLWQGQYVLIHIQQTYGCNRLSQRKVQPRCSFSSTVPTFRDWHFQNGYFQAPSAKVHVTPKGSFKWGTGTWISSRNINRKEQPIQMWHITMRGWLLSILLFHLPLPPFFLIRIHSMQAEQPLRGIKLQEN